MNPILLYPHGGSLNHGCEAIVRATAKILGGPPKSMTLFSMRPQEDLSVGLDRIVAVADHRYVEPLTRRQTLVASIHHKLTNTDNRFYRFKHAALLKGITRDSIALSIGGDNYCYGDCSWLYAANTLIHKRGARTVFWGCSVDPEDMDAAMVRDLNGFDLITPRESITCQGMLDKGVRARIALHPDPAFQLDKVDLPLPPGFEIGNTIGLNISPLIQKNEGKPGATLQSAKALIAHILKTTTAAVALIPHVTWVSNNDLEPLGELYALFKDTGRVILLADHDCLALKGFISRCRMFIGARTHATIAAYSTQVPTLVLGYSVKARGIARDIFGEEKDLVLPIQELMEPRQLIDAFEKLKEREQDLRQHLQAFMPGYVGRAADAAREIALLCNDGGMDPQP
ncbi:MAG: polysaccharide pyruvyl transferase family protein [Holophagaceae bacterium]|nr:polysaccharide pyruvyl transferase family protein [Holophagaceae bacterium]